MTNRIGQVITISAGTPAPDYGDPPEVSGLTPADGSTVDEDDAIQLDVTDDTGLEFVTITALVDGHAEVVWDGAATGAGYSLTPAAITDGFRYAFTRTAGWVTDFDITVTALDDGLQKTTETYSFETTYVAPVDAPPYITNITPDPSTPNFKLGLKDPVQLDVMDDSGIAICLLLVRQGLKYDVVHDGFAASANYKVTVTNITGGKRYVISPLTTWIAPPTFVIRVVDTKGQLG